MSDQFPRSRSILSPPPRGLLWPSARNSTTLYGFVRPLGWVISGNRGAYNYLTSSAAHYFMPDEVRDLFLKAGFSAVKYRELFFGAAGIHVATR